MVRVLCFQVSYHSRQQKTMWRDMFKINKFNDKMLNSPTKSSDNTVVTVVSSLFLQQFALPIPQELRYDDNDDDIVNLYYM
ncbi:MAG TPA: hypothetical protein VER14_06150 [Phototrophicaceae bacterium]|nr:hypothetical protein [Phototrophicaceae bacterium]